MLLIPILPSATRLPSGVAHRPNCCLPLPGSERYFVERLCTLRPARRNNQNSGTGQAPPGYPRRQLPVVVTELCRPSRCDPYLKQTQKSSRYKNIRHATFKVFNPALFRQNTACFLFLKHTIKMSCNHLSNLGLEELGLFEFNERMQYGILGA